MKRLKVVGVENRLTLDRPTDTIDLVGTFGPLAKR